MSKKGNIFTVILVILIMIALGLAGTMFYFFEKERVRSNTMQEELEDLRVRQKMTQKQLDDTKAMLIKLDSQLQESNKQIEILNSELDLAKKGAQDASLELEQVKTALRQRETAETEMRTKLIQSQKDMIRLQEQLKSMESEKSRLERKIKDLDETKAEKVELGEIIVGQQEAPVKTTAATATTPTRVVKSEALTRVAKVTAPKETSLEGAVLVVNKDYSFAVIDIGSQNGVRLGNVFSVYHKNKYVGDLKIEKVHEAMSAAGFVNPDLKDKISEGDRVVLQGK